MKRQHTEAWFWSKAAAGLARRVLHRALTPCNLTWFAPRATHCSRLSTLDIRLWTFDFGLQKWYRKLTKARNGCWIVAPL